MVVLLDSIRLIIKCYGSRGKVEVHVFQDFNVCFMFS